MSFVLESVCLCVVGLVFTFSPIKCFDSRFQVVKDPDDEEHFEVKKDKIISKISIINEKEELVKGEKNEE